MRLERARKCLLHEPPPVSSSAVPMTIAFHENEILLTQLRRSPIRRLVAFLPRHGFSHVADGANAPGPSSPPEAAAWHGENAKDRHGYGRSHGSGDPRRAGVRKGRIQSGRDTSFSAEAKQKTPRAICTRLL
jgi:hypothetical protein